MLSRTFLAGLLAALPSVQAIDKDWWAQVDCDVADVMVDGKYVDKDRSLKYDWQLTYQACINNYAPQVARYDHGSGRCVALDSNVGINGPQWWNNCVVQARDGWYDVDPKTNSIVITHNPYKSNHAEGRGY